MSIKARHQAHANYFWESGIEAITRDAHVATASVTETRERESSAPLELRDVDLYTSLSDTILLALPQQEELGPLFDNKDNFINFNNVLEFSYQPDTQYHALGGNDTVFLPSNLAEAAEAGYDPHAFDGHFHGGDGNDIIIGGSLNDHVSGDAGNDWLVGGSGNDTLSGGVGNDKLEGQNGDDWLSGNNGNDKLTGGKGDDHLHGDFGDDHVGGGDGNDIVVGEAGNDVLNGGDGKDILYGEEGSDIISGGKGCDQLYGGLHSYIIKDDIFVFNVGEGSFPFSQADVIHDFENRIDKIGLGSGLTFDDLIISNNGNDCVIFDKNSFQYVCVVKNAANQIDASDFITFG